MSTENRGNVPQQQQQPIPVYTVYPGNVDYGFVQGHPQASPPKYEDVVNGRMTSHQPGTYERAEPAVVFVTPYRYTRTSKALGIVFSILFIVGFVSVLIKVLSVR